MEGVGQIAQAPCVGNRYGTTSRFIDYPALVFNATEQLSGKGLILDSRVPRDSTGDIGTDYIKVSDYP